MTDSHASPLLQNWIKQMTDMYLLCEWIYSIDSGDLQTEKETVKMSMAFVVK